MSARDDGIAHLVVILVASHWCEIVSGNGKSCPRIGLVKRARREYHLPYEAVELPGTGRAKRSKIHWTNALRDKPRGVDLRRSFIGNYDGDHQVKTSA